LKRKFLTKTNNIVKIIKSFVPHSLLFCWQLFKPVKKSLDLLKRIISASSAKDGKRWCGSGTTLIASENLSRRRIGIGPISKSNRNCKKTNK
jgi:hypothetical protein